MPSEKEKLLRLHFGSSSSSFHSEKTPLLRSNSNFGRQEVSSKDYSTLPSFLTSSTSCHPTPTSSSPPLIRAPSTLLYTEEDLLRIFKKTNNVQKNLNETIQHLNLVVDNLLQRGTTLNAMHYKFENLEKSAKLFKRQANETNENTQKINQSFFSKYYCWLIVAVIPTLVIIIISFKLYHTYING